MNQGIIIFMVGVIIFQLSMLAGHYDHEKRIEVLEQKIEKLTKY